MRKQLTLFILAAAVASLQPAFAQSWNLTGNSNATTSSKLGTTNSVPLNFYTNNAQRATITALGRVGIGITSPINILTVKASGGVPSSNWTNVSTQIFYGFSEAANGEFNIGTATNTATQRSLIQGKRARGTLASPAAVQNNDYLASIVGSGYDGSAFQNPCEVDFYADGTPSAGHVPGRISFVTGTSISDRLERLKIGSTGDITINNNQFFVQQSSGNVGIGNTSPLYKLYVTGGSTSGVYSSSSGTYGIYSINSSSAGTGLYSSGGSLGVYGYGGTYGGSFYGGTSGVYGYSSTSSTSSSGVYGSAYHGVQGNGTYGVYGTGSSYGVYGDGGGSGTGVYGLSSFVGAEGSSVGGSYGVYGISGDIGIYGYGLNRGLYGVGSSSTSGSYGVYGSGNGYGVYGNGSVGVFAISSTSDGDGVHSTVSGSSNYGVNTYSASSFGIFAKTGNSGSYAGYFEGDVFTTGSYLPSDAKLKKNIKSVDNAMEIIKLLQPKNYEYRDDGNYAKMNLPAGKHYGFVVQDLEKVLPNLVKQSAFNTAKAEGDAVAPAPVTPDKDGKPVKPAALQPVKEVKGEVIDFKAINYTELIPILVKGMQEQQALITKEQTQITNQQGQITDQQGRITSQQQQINELKDLVKQLTGKDLTTGLNSVTLEQNIPNPLDKLTTIRYSIPAGSTSAQLLVTDISGKIVKQVQLTSMAGNVGFDATGLASGTYTYSIIVDGKLMQTKKMVVAKANQ